MRDPQASDFCYYPFMQILLTSDGKYRPCSKHQDYVSHEGRELSIHHGDTLEDAWGSDYMQDIRQHLFENRQFEGCRECWRMQRMGLRSMRYDSYQYGTSETQVVEPMRPTRIEINASNICNLKCRICYPNASSKWIKEHGELYGSNEKVYRNLPLPNLEQVKQWAESLEEVCFFGGEPLLSEENMELLDHFIETGHAARMSLLFNTNGTIFNDAVVERLRYFKRVRMYFSVDDIGERFEYQRKGAKWEEVVANIDKAYRLSRSPQGQNIDFKICCTVSIFNIYYFPEFFDWFGQHFPGLRIFWNLLFDPWRLNVQILPQPVKRVITERLQNHVRSTYIMSEPETKTVQELITFLNGHVDKPFEEFFWYVNRHDTFRGESFPNTYREFYELLAEYQPDRLRWLQHKPEDLIAKILRQTNDIEQIHSAIMNEVGALRSEGEDGASGVTYLQAVRDRIDSDPSVMLAVFAGIEGIPVAVAADHLTEALMLFLGESGVIQGSSWKQKIRVLRICLSRSEKMLQSLALTDRKVLMQELGVVNMIVMLQTIEEKFQIFSEESMRIRSGGIDWEDSNIFKDVSNACRSDLRVEDMLELGRKWAELFDGESEHIIRLLSVLLGLPADERPSGERSSSVSEKLIHVWTSILNETRQAKEDPSFSRKVSVLQVCAANSEGVLCALMLTETGQLAQDILELNIDDLTTRIESEHRFFSSFAEQLLSGEITWEECPAYRDCAKALFPENGDAGRWQLCEQWSYPFRNTPHLISLYLLVLNLTSASALADEFIAILNSMPDDGSDECLKGKIGVVEEVLKSEAREQALIDLLQTGRFEFCEVLRQQNLGEVRALIEEKYGVVVS